jgi:hypothetical protein
MSQQHSTCLSCTFQAGSSPVHIEKQEGLLVATDDPAGPRTAQAHLLWPPSGLHDLRDVTRRAWVFHQLRTPWDPALHNRVY